LFGALPPEAQHSENQQKQKLGWGTTPEKLGVPTPLPMLGTWFSFWRCLGVHDGLHVLIVGHVRK